MEPTLGVQMFTLRKYTQTEEDLRMALSRVRQMGYQSVHISAFGDVKAPRIAALCAEHDLQIGGTHVAWDRLRHDLDRVIDEHLQLKCTHTAVGMIPSKTYLSLPGLDRFLQELEPITSKLQAAGIDFAYHHHAQEFHQFDGKPWLQHLYESPLATPIMAELDTHWLQAGGCDPAVWIERYGHRMSLLQLKDFAINDEYQRVYAPVGDGNMHWDRIIDAARQRPIKYYFVEQDNCYGADEFECLRKSYDFLNQRYGLV
ncbi:MAG: sugar phosphate isomerase/epimerase [Candidatus Paceibacteria bacterium]|jgi:sugar phosphate isomerase/epimerase